MGGEWSGHEEEGEGRGRDVRGEVIHVYTCVVHLAVEHCSVTCLLPCSPVE